MNRGHRLIIKDLLQKAIEAAGFSLDTEKIQLERPKLLQHGHYSTNVAMLLAGPLKKNPREIAQAVLKNLPTNDCILKAEIAGPGFINLFIEQKFYTNELQFMAESIERYLAQSLSGPKKTMVIDTSHPNVAKPMGVHHLMSTIIGNVIARIYRAMGYKVINDNYLGDWGTQFGKLIYAIRTWGDEKEIAQNPIPELLKLYVRFHEEVKTNPALDDLGRAEFKKLEEGDPENRKLWKYIVDISLKEFYQVYDRLNVTFDVINGESFYEDKMPQILKEGREKGIIVEGEGGAWIIPSDNPDEPPILVRKSDGATLYCTRDLARIDYWEKTWHPDLMVNVVDVAQEFYFRQLFEAQRKFGLTKAVNIHVSFGRMQFKDGSMSTRKGNIIWLSSLLDEAEERALTLVQEKAVDLSPEDQKNLAVLMGVGAVKYNILSQNRLHNITFDWDTMLSFEGNSAPYLMYTATRAQSILRKADTTPKHLQSMELSITEDKEWNVALDLMDYAPTLRRAAEDYKPSHMATYLYALAQDFNAMYNDLPVLQAPSESAKNTRLLLTAGVLSVMRHGMDILGLKVPEKM